MAILHKPTTQEYEIHLEPIGDNTLASMEWVLYTETPSLSQVIKKSSAVEVDENTYNVIVDTATLEPGALTLRLQATIIDANAKGGTRKKVWVYETGDYISDDGM